jgi:hypothetical protein
MSEWFSPGHHSPTVPQQPKPTESLWTLRKGSGTVECGLLTHGEPGGVEVQLFGNGGFYAARRFELRAQAVAHGNELKANLEADGWTKGGA